MKKLLAVVLAVLMILPLNLLAFAESDSTLSFTVYTGDSNKTYNPTQQIYVTLKLRDISFGNGDGVSAFEFDIFYDKNKLTPVYSASTDSEGDAGDFAKLFAKDGNPGSWEAFGVLDSEKGKYGLAFSDTSGNGVINDDDALIIRIPFKVNENVRVNDIVFNFDNVTAYNKDMQSKCEIELASVSMKYAVQPIKNLSFPSDAIKLDVAGYRHDINNFVYYASTATTVSKLVKQYCGSSFKMDDLSTFAILIADVNGVITYVDTETGTSSDKSSVKIPAESYIIGVSSGNSDDLKEFKSLAKVGQQVTIYNVNIEATGRGSSATDLNRAAFIIDKVGLNPPFVGGNDPDDPFVEDDPDISPPDNGDYMLGDVNDSGAIDMMDYILLKRNYFGTFDFDAGQLQRGDCNKSGAIDMMDYILLKRAYFGTFDLGN